jgi:hypothetical protein
MSNSHDEIKKLLDASRKMLSSKDSINESNIIKKQYGILTEENGIVSPSKNIFQKINVAKTIEQNIKDDETKEYETAKDQETVEYRVSGGVIVLHGTSKKELVLTEDEKQAFQETMDEFVDEVSNMVDFNPLHIYEKNVIWSGFIRKQNFTFIYNLNDGVYFEVDTMIKLDDELLDLQKKLEKYFSKFESKWADIIANRIKTKVNGVTSSKKDYETYNNSNNKNIGL